MEQQGADAIALSYKTRACGNTRLLSNDFRDRTGLERTSVCQVLSCVTIEASKYELYYSLVFESGQRSQTNKHKHHESQLKSRGWTIWPTSRFRISKQSKLSALIRPYGSYLVSSAHDRSSACATFITTGYITGCTIHTDRLIPSQDQARRGETRRCRCMWVPSSSSPFLAVTSDHIGDVSTGLPCFLSSPTADYIADNRII